MIAVFVAAAVVAVAGAVGVVASRTPVHGVLAMLVNFAGLAALFLTLQAEFLAIAQVLIYAGAVMVLFLFVISLLSARARPVEGPVDRLRSQLPLAVLAAGVLLGAILASVAGPLAAPVAPQAGWGEAVGLDFGGVGPFGEMLLREFPFELEMVGLLLLVAAVGVMVLVGRRAETPVPGSPGAGAPAEVAGMAARPAAAAPAASAGSGEKGAAAAYGAGAPQGRG